jgi:hypothetical protein
MKDPQPKGYPLIWTSGSKSNGTDFIKACSDHHHPIQNLRSGFNSHERVRSTKLQPFNHDLTVRITPDPDEILAPHFGSEDSHMPSPSDRDGRRHPTPSAAAHEKPATELTPKSPNSYPGWRYTYSRQRRNDGSSSYQAWRRGIPRPQRWRIYGGVTAPASDSQTQKRLCARPCPHASPTSSRGDLRAVAKARNNPPPRWSTTAATSIRFSLNSSFADG